VHIDWVQVSMVASAMIAQLEAVGGLHEWAVYIALHLPDDIQRAHTVEQLLARHAPEWAADAQKRSFLLQRLQIPAASLSIALSVWAQVGVCYKTELVYS
jgi:nuclear pore complex protein Nup98-Nup96